MLATRPQRLALVPLNPEPPARRWALTRPDQDTWFRRTPARRPCHADQRSQGQQMPSAWPNGDCADRARVSHGPPLGTTLETSRAVVQELAGQVFGTGLLPVCHANPTARRRHDRFGGVPPALALQPDFFSVVSLCYHGLPGAIIRPQPDLSTTRRGGSAAAGDAPRSP